MGRVAQEVTCSDQDRKELERLSNSRTGEARLVERANIVLACLAGQRNDEIAARLQLQANTVGIWRKRIVALGIMGLHDKARSGKPPTYDPRELRERIPQATGTARASGGAV